MIGYKCDNCSEWFKGKPISEWQITPKDTSKIDRATFTLLYINRLLALVRICVGIA